MSLAALQSTLRDLVASAPVLAGRTVLSEDKGNLASDVEMALAMQSLAVVVAAASGRAKPDAARRRVAFEETLEIVIHRGLLEDPAGLTTATVVDSLIQLVHGAALSSAPGSKSWAVQGHELRENDDGTYARVITVVIDHTYSATSS